jgi:2-polyprenyl-3-methyl-5-hydroxy-6-metoxy-1,4-benzoquinol methylase
MNSSAPSTVNQFDYNPAYFNGKLSDWTAISIGTISSRLVDTLKREQFPRDGVAVDFGCGSGAYFPYLKQSSLDVVGMDIAPEAVKQASNRPYKDVLLIAPDGRPLPDQSAAIVFSTEVLEHIEDAEAAIKNFNRMLKKDGLLILTTTLYFSSINVYLSTAIQQKHPLSKIIREIFHYLLGFFSARRQKSFVLKWCYQPLGGHFHGFKSAALKNMISEAGFQVTEAWPLYIFEPVGFSRYSTISSVRSAFHFPKSAVMMLAVSAISACNVCLKALGLGANNIYLVARKTASV